MDKIDITAGMVFTHTGTGEKFKVLKFTKHSTTLQRDDKQPFRISTKFFQNEVNVGNYIPHA